jgi:hypothetical protein
LTGWVGEEKRLRVHGSERSFTFRSANRMKRRMSLAAATPERRHPIPWRVAELMRLPEEQLGKIDIALVHLLCALDLPGSEKFDLALCLRRIDEMAEGTSGVEDRFLYGIIQGEGGTCATLPARTRPADHVLDGLIILQRSPEPLEISHVRTAPDSTTTPRSRAARRVWVERLTRFPTSGLSPAQLCASEGVSLPSFYPWRRRLLIGKDSTGTEPTGDAPGPRPLPVRLASTMPCPNSSCLAGRSFASLPVDGVVAGSVAATARPRVAATRSDVGVRRKGAKQERRLPTKTAIRAKLPKPSRKHCGAVVPPMFHRTIAPEHKSRMRKGHKLLSLCPLHQSTRPGFEPGQREPKSLVLPLHHRVSNQVFRRILLHSL